MRILFAAILMAAAVPAAAQLVKCVDEKGRTHYTDKPQTDCKGAKSQTQLAPAPEAPRPAAKPAPAAKSPPPAPKQPDLQARQKPPARAKSEQEQRMASAECKNASEMLALVSGPSGEGMQNRESRIEHLRKMLRNCP